MQRSSAEFGRLRAGPLPVLGEASPGPREESYRSGSFCHFHFLRDKTQKPRWIPGNNGVVGHVASHSASRADQRVFANNEIREDRCARTNRGALFHQRWLHAPIFFGLGRAIGRGGAWIRVVDERDAVTNKNVVFDGHALTDKTVTRDLAVPANPSVLLNLHERAHTASVADLTTVKINELGESDVFAQLNVLGDARVGVHS